MTGLVFHLIPHTHWDREWYLPRAAFQARLVPALDALLDLLQSDATYRTFLLDGQTVLVEDYLRIRPERDADVRALVKAARLQVGPWYVLADELIPSGEALVRNLLLGAVDAERLGGRNEVLYSPDAFGHPAVWPTLAREFGLKHGVVWRGLGGEPGQEKDWYRWRGPDNQDVALWHMPPQGYEIGAALPADADRLPAAWAPVRDALVRRATGKHLAVFIGADHHAPHLHVSRLRDLLADLERDNAVRVSRLDEFCRAASAELADMPLLSGELRWSYRYAWTLQGVHGSRTPLKRRNSSVELWLERFAEPLAALARRAGGADRRSLLDTAWRALVRSQFHDTIAGTVSDAVAQAAATRLDDVEATAREVVRASVWDLVRHDPDAAREQTARRPSLVVWNPAARARSAITVAEVTMLRRGVPIGPPGGRAPRAGAGYRPFAFLTPAGDVIPVQSLARAPGRERLEAVRHYPVQDEVDRVRVAFRMPPVPGLGLATLTMTEARGEHGPETVVARGKSLANQFVEVSVDASGALTLRDRETGESFRDLLRLEAEGDAGDLYTFCPAGGAGGGRRTAATAQVRRLATGPLVAALEIRTVLRLRTGDVTASIVVTLHADSPIVRCVLELDNQATDHRLRARFPTGLRGVATAGTAFGTVSRPPVDIEPADYPLETPALTAPGQRFVAVADGRRGLALLTPGFFEYQWTPRGDLLLTLLRAVGELSRGDLRTRLGHAAWPTSTPLAQCPGITRVELGLVAVSQADIERGDAVPALWEDACLPLRGFWLRDAVQLVPAPVEIALEGAGLVLSAVKPAQAGSPLVLRCYNATSRRTAGAWRVSGGVKTAHRVRANERESVPIMLEGRGTTVRFVAEPHDIVTILVT
ncbi:MAG TPA: glycoside hydrolase family 38 C-terminal domain-containing protein [Gemmatimonadales bacterium]|nr:glycoside hydrolase family 38 C-terminal domain-containing protein [Gemmatimonadales bacterium]